MFDPYEAWLGIPPERRPPTLYDLLDISPDEHDAEAIRQAAMRRMSGLLARPDRMHGGECARLMNEITEAQAVLLDPARRQDYDTQLVEQTTRPVGEVPEARPVVPPAVEQVRTRRPAPDRIREIVLPILEAPAEAAAASPPAAVPVPAVTKPAGRQVWLVVAIGAGGLVGLFGILGIGAWLVLLRPVGPVASVKDTRPRSVSPTLLPTERIPDTNPNPEPEKPPQPESAAGEAKPEPKGEERGEAKPEPRHQPAAEARLSRASRPAPPEGAELARAEKVVRDVFGDDLAKRKPPEVLAAAARMVQQARDTRDPAARFVMLREAGRYAAQAGNAAAALAAFDELGQEFDVATLEMKTAALEAAAKGAASRSLVETILSAIDAAVAADSYEHAGRLLKAAEVAAKTARVLPVHPGIATRAREVEQLRPQFAHLTASLATYRAVRSEVKEPELLREIGQYECLWKGDWAAGLARLAAGGGPLEKLAAADLAGPLSHEDQLAVADGWWEYAENQSGLARGRIQERAVAWYAEALPKLAGLDREKAEKRVKSVAAGLPPAGTTLTLAALRDWRELGEAKVPNDWSLRGGKLGGRKEGVFWFAPYFSGDFWVSAVFVHGVESFVLAFGPGAVYGAGEFWVVEVAPDGQAQVRVHQGSEVAARVDLKLEPGRRVLSVRVTGREVALFADGVQKLQCRLGGDFPAAHRCGLVTATGNVALESVAFGSSRTTGPRFEIAPEFALYEGKWAFKYATYDGKTQTTADYSIDALGNVVDPANKDRRGLLLRRGNEVFVEYTDGSVERLGKQAGGRLATQTYANLKAYPSMPTAAGIGVRKQ